MLTFTYQVQTRTGVVIALGTVEARTATAAKGKVRRMPRIYPMDLIFIGEGF